jgi:hypothetical protein
VIVIVVDADWPALEIFTVDGLGDIRNGGPTSRRTAEEVEPEKFESPLY